MPTTLAAVGSHRSVVEVQALTETRDSWGQALQSWTTIATLRALIRSPNGREIFDAGQRKATLSHVLECGRDAALMQAAGTITPNHRVLFGGVQYGIEWLNNTDMKNRSLVIHAVELVAPGIAP